MFLYPETMALRIRILTFIIDKGENGTFVFQRRWAPQLCDSMPSRKLCLRIVLKLLAFILFMQFHWNKRERRDTLVAYTRMLLLLQCALLHFFGKVELKENFIVRIIESKINFQKEYLSFYPNSTYTARRQHKWAQDMEGEGCLAV